MNELHDTFKEQLNDLPFEKRQLLRRLAVEKLKDFSFEEIGSSDISNELFSMWKSYHKIFDAILEDHWIDS
jgi:hypothetical protein